MIVLTENANALVTFPEGPIETNYEQAEMFYGTDILTVANANARYVDSEHMSHQDAAFQPPVW